MGKWRRLDTSEWGSGGALVHQNGEVEGPWCIRMGKWRGLGTSELVM